MPMPPIPVKCRCCRLKNISPRIVSALAARVNGKMHASSARGCWVLGSRLLVTHRATSSRISAARRAAPGCARPRAAAPMRANPAGSAANSRHGLEQSLARHLPVLAPAAPRPRARRLPRCATGVGRPRTERANQNGRLARRRQFGHRARARPAHHQVGLRERRRHIRDERQHLALQSGCRERRAPFFIRARSSLMDDAHGPIPPRETAANFRAPARFNVRDPWLPPVISKVNVPLAASAEWKRTPRAPAAR